MAEFQFEGEFLSVDFDFTEEMEHELVVEFGDIRIPSEFYWWITNVELWPNSTFAQRVRDLHDSKKHEAAFGLMLIKMLEAWREIVKDGTGNLLVSFFDQYCDILRVNHVDEGTTRLSLYWTSFETSELEIGFAHPIDLQTEYGDMPGIETWESDQPDQRVETATLLADLERASDELSAWVDRQIDDESHKEESLQEEMASVSLDEPDGWADRVSRWVSKHRHGPSMPEAARRFIERLARWLPG